MVSCLTSSPNQLRLTGTHLSWFKWKNLLRFSVTSQEICPNFFQCYVRCEEIIVLRLGMLSFRPMHLSFPTRLIPVGRHGALPIFTNPNLSLRHVVLFFPMILILISFNLYKWFPPQNSRSPSLCDFDYVLTIPQINVEFAWQTITSLDLVLIVNNLKLSDSKDIHGVSPNIFK